MTWWLSLSRSTTICEALSDEPTASGVSLRSDAFETPKIIDPIIATVPRIRRHRLALSDWKDPACRLQAAGAVPQG